jgi:general secretion pathway protein E
MNVGSNVSAAPQPVTAGSTANLLASLLPAADAPWALAFDAWPPHEAQRWRVVLVRSASGALTALSDHPVEAMLHERMESNWQAVVRLGFCPSETLDHLLQAGAAGFRALASIQPDASRLEAPSDAAELSALHVAEQTSPVVRLLDATLYDALNDGVSDLHFECVRGGLNIRCRIDGVMQAVRQIDGSAVAEQLVSRLKVMAELDIGERRLPQDGRFQLRMAARDVDFRLSVMPSVFGEDAVVRILDRAQVQQSQGGLTLEALGFDAETRQTLRRLARQPHGMLLVTGPTGSGKTTTLYAAINEINVGNDKIITIEDPVEYQLAGVVQIPVNEKKGLTFARGLRSVLRHDPDRVMVGEIRDPETAQIAVQAALTGHLVFSTVHANHCFDVIGRFMHMGLDLYNVVSALNAVVAQRLLRINCLHCRRAVAMPAALRGRLCGSTLAPHSDLMRGDGCVQCRGTGYKGRRAVAELLVLDTGLRDLIAARAPLGQIRQAALDRGMRTLREAATDLVLRGETSLEELDRVTHAD